MKFSSRERNIFLVLLVFLALGLFLKFSRPGGQGAGDTQDQEILMAQKKLRENLRLIRQAKAIRGQYQPLLAQYQQQERPEEIMSTLLSEIQGISNRLQVPITDLKPNKVRRVEAFNHFSVSLAVEGDLAEIMQFVYTLQNPPYNFFVDEFQLRREYSKAKRLRSQIVFKKVFLPR